MHEFAQQPYLPWTLICFKSHPKKPLCSYEWNVQARLSAHRHASDLFLLQKRCQHAVLMIHHLNDPKSQRFQQSKQHKRKWAKVWEVQVWREFMGYTILEVFCRTRRLQDCGGPCGTIDEGGQEKQLTIMRRHGLGAVHHLVSNLFTSATLHHTPPFTSSSSSASSSQPPTTLLHLLLLLLLYNLL